MGQVEDGGSAAAETQAGETSVYRRADVEGFAEWARTTIAGLQAELAETQRLAAAAEQRAIDAEHALADREGLEVMLRRAADAAADAAATAAVQRVEALLDDARAKARGEWSDPAPTELAADVPVVYDEQERDPLLDPLPPWNDRLRAFPDEPSDLPPIGSIFEDDTHRTA